MLRFRFLPAKRNTCRDRQPGGRMGNGDGVEDGGGSQEREGLFEGPPSAWVLAPPLCLTHLLLRVQVQEVGGIQAPVHALLVPGQSAAYCPALGGRSKHELPGLVHFHRWGWGPLLLLGGGRGCISLRAPAPLPSADSPCQDAGRAGRTTHRFLFGERTEAAGARWAPPLPQQLPRP